MSLEKRGPQLPESFSDFLKMKGNQGTYATPGSYPNAVKMKASFLNEEVTSNYNSGGVLSLEINSETDFNNAKKVLKDFGKSFYFSKSPIQDRNAHIENLKNYDADTK